MNNEILIIKKLFEIVEWDKAKSNIEYLKDILQEDKEELIDTLKHLNHYPTYYHLIKLHGIFLSINKDFYDIIKLITYASKKGYIIQKYVFCSFNPNQSINLLLHNVIIMIVHLSKHVPVKKISYKSIEDVNVMLENFNFHGHHLSNLSQNKDTHYINNIVLYLRYVNKVVHVIYRTLVRPMLIHYPSDRIRDEIEY